MFVEYPSDTHDVSHKNPINHVDRSLECHLTTNAFPLCLLSIPNGTSVPIPDMHGFSNTRTTDMKGGRVIYHVVRVQLMLTMLSMLFT